MGDTYDDIVDDLDAYMAGLDDEGAIADEPPPVPVDVEAAEMLMRRIARFEREVRFHQAAADAQIKKVRAFLDDRTAGLRRQIEHNAVSLEGWMREVNRSEGKKTMKLLSGEARVRPAQVTVGVVDEDRAVGSIQILNQALGQPGLIRTTEAVAKTALKDLALPGALVDDPPAPAGYEHRSACVIIDWISLGLIVVPVVWPIDGLYLAVPTTTKFGYTTKETTR